jgi:hypothetical protein
VSTSDEHAGATIFTVESVKQVKGDPTAPFVGPAKL